MRGRLYIGIAIAACALGAGLVGTSVFSAKQDEPEAAPMQQVAANETNALLSGIPQDGTALGPKDARALLVVACLQRVRTT
jgi:hypothetical protein